LENLKLPVLVAWGEEDRLVPLRHAAEFRGRIGGALLRTFPGCGHSLPLENPAELAAVIEKFCSEQIIGKESI
jgi:pimeloyl-ACP methyl ester carboxylesterase